MIIRSTYNRTVENGLFFRHNVCKVDGFIHYSVYHAVYIIWLRVYVKGSWEKQYKGVGEQVDEGRFFDLLTILNMAQLRST